MSLTCVIVEDLQVAADFLVRCCQKSGQVEVKGHFTNAEEALKYLNANTVDLIFLDVEMPGSTGFELLDQLMYKPRVILTTSKTEYAYNAFEYKVTDFLKKPFTYQRFTEALQKAIEAGESTPASNGAVNGDSTVSDQDRKSTRLNSSH